MSSLTEATHVTTIDSHHYSGVFLENWCIGNVPHGGFVTSCILAVASLHFNTTLHAQNQPHALTLHLSFLRRTTIGPVTFTVKDVKLGRQTSIIHITVTQDTREEVVGYVTHSNLHTETGISLPTSWALSPIPCAVNISKLETDSDQQWKLQEPILFPEFRRAAINVQFYIPRTSVQKDKSFADQWLRFTNGERFTMESLGYVADMFPQIVEAYREDEAEEAASGLSVTRSNSTGLGHFWYPTLLLNLEIKKALPPEGVEWLFSRVRAKQIKNGRMDLEVLVFDTVGNMVALSHHVALIVGAERNLAKVGQKGGEGQSKL